MSLTLNKVQLEGILLIDKPSGCTSHDVVDRVRKKLKMKRIGHAGTLDPLATGLLIILVGKSTKASQYLISLDKEYEATLLLGQVTDSQDADGQIMVTKEVPDFTREQIESVVNAFHGDQYQLPPMFSAKKVNGVPLYKMARKGEEVVREPRFIRISKIQVTDFSSPHVSFAITCSKGTYVRTIAHDIGQKLSCGAHLIQLRRTATDKFRIENALTLESFEDMTLHEIRDHLIPTYKALPALLK
ncbi:MAG: tRNA pseudouridine(55) synthase TruB [Verrucomicrobia bacterium]|nr:MAG: tRNA pseudouridine(55) synthase TruB [Verrucomicrobiota bacterium]